MEVLCELARWAVFEGPLLSREYFQNMTIYDSIELFNQYTAALNSEDDLPYLYLVCFCHLLFSYNIIVELRSLSRC